MALVLRFNEETHAWVSKLSNSSFLRQWQEHAATQLAAVETYNDCVSRLKAETTDVTLMAKLIVKCRQAWRQQAEALRAQKNLLKKGQQGNWEQSAAEVGQQNWKLVIDTIAGNESVKFPFKLLPELENDDMFLHAIEVVAEFRLIDKQIMANRQKLKK